CLVMMAALRLRPCGRALLHRPDMGAGEFLPDPRLPIVVHQIHVREILGVAAARADEVPIGVGADDVAAGLVLRLPALALHVLAAEHHLIEARDLEGDMAEAGLVAEIEEAERVMVDRARGAQEIAEIGAAVGDAVAQAVDVEILPLDLLGARHRINEMADAARLDALLAVERAVEAIGRHRLRHYLRRRDAETERKAVRIDGVERAVGIAAHIAVAAELGADFLERGLVVDAPDRLAQGRAGFIGHRERAVARGADLDHLARGHGEIAALVAAGERLEPPIVEIFCSGRDIFRAEHQLLDPQDLHRLSPQAPPEPHPAGVASLTAMLHRGRGPRHYAPIANRQTRPYPATNGYCPRNRLGSETMDQPVSTTRTWNPDKFRLRRLVERLVEMDEIEVRNEQVALSEMSPIIENTKKGVLFKKAGPEEHEVVGAVSASRSRLAAAFGVPENKMREEFLRDR